MPVIEPFGELAKRILKCAGYTPGDDVAAFGGQYQNEFVDLMRVLTYIGARKVDDYGDFRLQDIRSWDREVWGAYWDIQRKFGRLENQIGQLVRPVDGRSKPKVASLMETLGDQAVYCVRMIQILRRLEEKGLVPNECCDHGDE